MGGWSLGRPETQSLMGEPPLEQVETRSRTSLIGGPTWTCVARSGDVLSSLVKTRQSLNEL